MCVGRYAEKMQWSEAKWNLFEMPAIDLSVLCIPAECDNIKLPIECEIASRWDAYLLCDICRHFASVVLHFASLILHNLRCIPAYTHLIPTGFIPIIINNYLCRVRHALPPKANRYRSSIPAIAPQYRATLYHLSAQETCNSLPRWKSLLVYLW